MSLGQHGPRSSGHFVGQRYDNDIDVSTIQQPINPTTARAASDDRTRARH